MPGPAQRRSSFGHGAGVLALGLAALAALVRPAPARAEGEGPYFDPGALPVPGYELRTRLAYGFASREDFSAPVFLFAQPPLALDAHELRAELDLRVGLAPALALQAIVPVVYRRVDATLDAVLVSPEQQLAPAELTLTGLAAADATLGLALRFVQSESVALFLDAGTIVPLDDNSGGTTLPRRIPGGTGQSALFVGLGASLRAGALDASLAYRLRFAPGDGATYLVRRVGTQGYTSGAFAPSLAHTLGGALGYAATQELTLLLCPDLSHVEQPDLVTRGGTLAVPGPSARDEIGLALQLKLALHPHHVIVLGYRHTLLDSHEDDPFFPLALPQRGPSLAWHVTGE